MMSVLVVTSLSCNLFLGLVTGPVGSWPAWPEPYSRGHQASTRNDLIERRNHVVQDTIYHTTPFQDNRQYSWTGPS